jgi:hypothetical protein
MKGDPTPEVQESKVVRTKDIIQLFDKHLVQDTNNHDSDMVECGAFRKFGLHLFIDSTGAPTTIRFIVQFLNRWDGRWYSYKQGPFAALYYEDTDTASGVVECFQGEVLGRAIRVRAVGVGTTSAAYFAISASVELYN